MKGKTKRKFTADFKLEAVLVLKEKETLAVISKRHELLLTNQRLKEAVSEYRSNIV